MKQIVLGIFLTLPASLGAALPTAELPSVCDQRYAEETESVIRQATGFAGENLLKDYRDYMILLKRFEDLLFEVHEFESNISALTTGTLARLRTPATKYNACRNERVLNPSITAQVCDATYALYMQAILKELALSQDKNNVERYKEHMIQLKHLEDTRFRIHTFETQTKLSYTSTLRAALTNYLGCRDLITRTKARLQSPGQTSTIR